MSRGLAYYRAAAQSAGNVVQGCTFPNWIGDQPTAEQLKEVVNGDHMLEIFQSGDVRVEIHWRRVIAP